jgi:hypothetical protein
MALTDGPKAVDARIAELDEAAEIDADRRGRGMSVTSERDRFFTLDHELSGALYLLGELDRQHANGPDGGIDTGPTRPRWTRPSFTCLIASSTLVVTRASATSPVIQTSAPS